MSKNYRLGVSSIRGMVQKHGYIIESGGVTLETRVSSIENTNLKADLLLVLTQGLRSVAQMVEHDDILYIEIPNKDLARWLSGQVEYKGYEKELDSVFEVLERVDCRYKFVYIAKPYAREVVLKTKLSLNEGSSILEAFNELE